VTEQLKVHLDAMSRYAEAMDDLAASFARTKGTLLDADVTADSFGLLSESRDAAGVYEQRTTDGLAVLRTGEEVFGDLGQAFRQLRDNYHSSDSASSGRFGGGR
jgi:hypothetical protein